MTLLTTLWILCYRFFLTGLFAVGGGLATLPFLYEIGKDTGWFTDADVLNMLAVSESTPGPIGVNMATYTGFTVSGWYGALLSTFSLILPSFLVAVIISGFLEKFKTNPLVQGTFSTLRPASTALIAAAGVNVALKVLFPEGLEVFFSTYAFNSKALILAAVILAVSLLWKKISPIWLIVASAAAGVIFQM